MDGPFHYREAERRLLMAWEEGRDPADSAHLVAEAQVHATLALAAVTAVQPAAYGSNNPVRKSWEDATKTQAEPFYMPDRLPGQVEPQPAISVEIPLGYVPRRGDQIETWLTGMRDQFKEGDARWSFLDDLRDEYRALAEDHTPLKDAL